MTHTGHERIAKLLVETGANPNALNMYNDSALIIAIKNGIRCKIVNFV